MITLNIDRIVLDGFHMTQSRAESIKSFLQTELHQRLAQGSLRDGLYSGDRSHVTSQRLPINESYSDNRIATSLAGNIIGALNGKGNK